MIWRLHLVPNADFMLLLASFMLASTPEFQLAFWQLTLLLATVPYKVASTHSHTALLLDIVALSFIENSPPFRLV